VASIVAAIEAPLQRTSTDFMTVSATPSPAQGLNAGIAQDHRKFIRFFESITEVAAVIWSR